MPVVQGACGSQYMPSSESRGAGASHWAFQNLRRPARAGEPGRLLSMQAPVWILIGISLRGPSKELSVVTRSPVLKLGVTARFVL